MLCSRKLGCWYLLWVVVFQEQCIIFHRGQWKKLLYLLEEEVGSRNLQEGWELWKCRRIADIPAEAWHCWEGQPSARDHRRDLAEEPCGQQRGGASVELKMSPREQPQVTVTEPAEHGAVLTLFCSYSVSFWLGMEGNVQVSRSYCHCNIYTDETRHLSLKAFEGQPLWGTSFKKETSQQLYFLPLAASPSCLIPSCFLLLSPPCISRDEGQRSWWDWAVRNWRRDKRGREERRQIVVLCRKKIIVLGNCVLVWRNIPHAVKGELMLAVININDLQITIVGVVLLLGKYLSSFMHSDFQILSIQ